MSHETRAKAFPAPLFTSRGRKGRWVYLLAVLWPAWEAMYAFFSPYPLYGYAHWISAAVVIACAIQFYRPTVALWFPVLLWYAERTFQAIVRQVGAFQDYGSEDHSRWEGWHTEWVFLTFTAFLLFVTLATAVQIRARGDDAT